LVGWRFGAEAAVAGALGAMLGHCFTVWLRFKGGKGVATFFGVLLGLHWPTMLIAVLIWLGTATLTRYSSLSALLASAAAPFVLIAFGQRTLAAACALIAALIWLRHRANLKRLMTGEETRIGRA
jgi:glycerol-3-phosphate acyltransferase PlsY